ncbi:hypothetical protein ODJ79_13605 [Actinoplanes sp. KI2]|uniref:hypothetical protein n=1 Tax=Actinoplanes sp. KI2 TaxID=2983315 RepID=UPI0021D5E27E|nr:hypothetical protein [Actinoplanes sp. KI2]MCU7724755.1 hypothetical protein [Actinoplanes sp. KI2]
MVTNAAVVGAPDGSTRSGVRGTPGSRPGGVRAIERACYLIGAVLIAGGLFHAAVLVASGDTWTGPVSWRKPATFGFSFGLTLITIAWVGSYLPLRERGRRLLLGVFAAACVTEVALITLQAWRRVPSHFNMETGLDTAISRVLAAGGGVLILVIVALTVASWRPMPTVPPSMRLALRAGLLALDVALLVGAVMVVTAVLDVYRGDQTAAYAVGAQWKPAHFVPMHGVLALPLLAWLLARTPLPERSRLHTVALAVAGYATLCALSVIESAAGIDPLAGPLAADVLTALATAAIVAAAARTLAVLRGPRRPTT